MSRQEFCEFLNQSLAQMMVISGNGALLYVFMDWRHAEELLQVGRDIGPELKNICVWNKTTPGQGSFYRSAHELIVVFYEPGAPSINNIKLGKLGKLGKNRSNVWTYPGVSSMVGTPQCRAYGQPSADTQVVYFYSGEWWKFTPVLTLDIQSGSVCVQLA